MGENRREIFRAETSILNKNKRFFLGIKNKSIKPHVHQNGATQLCIKPIAEIRIKEQAMQLVLFISDREIDRTVQKPYVLLD